MEIHALCCAPARNSKIHFLAKDNDMYSENCNYPCPFSYPLICNSRENPINRMDQPIDNKQFGCVGVLEEGDRSISK
jgi:hypothetical protein